MILYVVSTQFGEESSDQARRVAHLTVSVRRSGILEQRYENQNEGRCGSLLVLLFIVLLIIKAMGFDLSWWIVTSPLWITFIYFFLVDLFELDRD